MTAQFKKYERYKESNLEWLGKIPETWTKQKLTWIFNLIGSGTTPTSSNSAYYDGNIPWLITGDLNDGIICSTSKTVTKFALEEYSSLKVFPENSLVMAMYGATIGKLGLTKIRTTTNQACCVMALPTNADIRFLFYWLMGNRGEILNLSQGGGQPNISQNIIRSLRLFCPSISEQEQIADFLDQKTSEIDSIIADKEKLIYLLNEQWRKIITVAVTRGFKPDVQMKGSQVKWIGKTPEHWTVCKINYRYSIELGKMLDEKRIDGKSLVPYLRNQDVQWGFINVDDLPEMDISETERERYTVKSGDLLVCEGGDVGRAAIWLGNDNEIGFQKALHRVRPRNQEDDTSEFLYFVLTAAKHSGAFSENDSKATISHLTGEKFRQYRFAFPPIDEQIEIADKLAYETKEINELIQELKESIVLLNEYRQSLIFEAVTGKIDVRLTVVGETAV